jgi:hypothetical protein
LPFRFFHIMKPTPASAIDLHLENDLCLVTGDIWR